MAANIRVRAAGPGDVTGMARVHVESWRQSYRGLMPDEVLDDPELPARRVGMWGAVLGDQRFRDRRVAVAEIEGEIVGIAMSGPAEEGASAPRQLFVLYLLAAHHGSGAGGELLDAVVGSDEDVQLWVADPNPRAQAFYRRRGFVADGAEQEDHGIREIRMTRAASRVPRASAR